MTTESMSWQDKIRNSRGAGFALVLIAGMAVGGAGVWMMRGTPEADVMPTEEHAADLPEGTVEVPEAAQKNANIEVAAAAVTRVPGTLAVTGSVTPDEARVAHVRPLARGVVEQIAVSLGSRVTAGQTLLTYDNIELGQLVGQFLTEQAALRQTRTDQQVRRTSLDRAEALIKIEAIAQQELDVRRAEVANAEAAVASAQARVSGVEEQLHRFGLSDADLKALAPDSKEAPHRVGSHSTLRAPFAGVVTKLNAANGEVVEPADEVFTIADISTVWVLADVYEKDLSKVTRDGTVAITVDAYPDRVFTGRITHVSDLIDPTTRTARVRCVVENKDGALKLDMFAKVMLGTREDGQALAVPADAVQQVEGQAVVFTQESATRFVRHVVQIGRRSGDLVEILSGVDEGQRVVGKGSFYLKTALLRELIGDEH